MTNEAHAEIAELEAKIYADTLKLAEMRRSLPADPDAVIPAYTFETLGGAVTLADMFGDHNKLMVIHNMGQACRYCTLWADGINGFLPHLESAFSVYLVSKDSVDTQRRMANSRGWRFQMASHGGGTYIQEQSVVPKQNNMPGVVVYQRSGDQILRMGSAVFGPGDLYCSIWNLLALGGLTEQDWTPQFGYWRRPEVLEDGGENVVD